MKMPSKKVLGSDPKLFAWFKSQRQDEVEGAILLGADNATLHSCIVIGTHGNEVQAGLAVLRWLLTHQDQIDEKSDVLVVIGNVQACENYFAATTVKERGKCRKTPDGSDMNRQPAADATLDTYEYQRALQLRKLCAAHEVEDVLDIHATDAVSDPGFLGIVDNDGHLHRLIGQLPVSECFTDVGLVQAREGTKTMPIGAFLLPSSTACEIECGKRGVPESAITAKLLAVIWGRFVGLLNPVRTLRMVASVMLPSIEYRVADAKFLRHLEPVMKDEVLLEATGNRMVKSPCDGVVVWSPDEMTFSELGSETWFIAQDA